MVKTQQKGKRKGTIAKAPDDSDIESSENEEELLNAVKSDDDSSDSDREINPSDSDEAPESESDESDSPATDSEPEDATSASESNSDVSSDNESDDDLNEVSDKDVSSSDEEDEVAAAPPTPAEYDSHDTSDEEDIRNTIGNVPMNWYDDYKHLGYDWDGNQIIKPVKGDHLDAFLQQIDDPNFWRTVKDPQTGQSIVLTPEDIALIQRIKNGRIPDATIDEYAPWIEWFTSETMVTPLRPLPDHKRSFLPSRSESAKISKLVHALKMGWIKTRAELAQLRAKKQPQFYMLWGSDDHSDDMRRIHKHIPAPKRRLPGHAESYNPPPEYLFDTKELKQWNKQKNAPWKRKLHFIPQKYDSLRQVPSYPRFIKERFLRCLDLYLCPRGIKMKLNIEPESLVPKLPSPKDLQPFPVVLAMDFQGHTDMVRSISTDKTGQYLASGSDDCTVKIWEINTGRCLKTIDCGGVVRSVDWCPNSAISLILVAATNRVILINPHVGDSLVAAKTDQVLESAPPLGEALMGERLRTSVEWAEPVQSESDDYQRGLRLVVKHFKEVGQVTWHGRGDYFASVMPDGLNRSVVISQLSRRRSQLPFTKAKGLVQSVLFHPTKPFLFVATQRHVRIYDLVKQNLVKKLLTNSKWISCMAIHPGGDNLLVGTYDRKMLWFDLDLSTKPYQTLRLHGTAVRGVAFHRRYPLFASGADDKSLIVSHGMVYNDLLKNPLIVPLKRLQDHETRNDFGILDVVYHPLQPWVFSAGADGTVKMYSN